MSSGHHETPVETICRPGMVAKFRRFLGAPSTDLNEILRCDKRMIESSETVEC